MRALQTTVLNNIRPGIVPVFIVAPNLHDGDGLAALLSESWTTGNAKGYEQHEGSKNYFSSAGTRRLQDSLADYVSNRSDDYRATMRLIFDEGFHSKTLWGMQLDYRMFFDVQPYLIFPEAVFIFLYGTRQKRTDADGAETYITKILRYHTDHPSTSALLHKKDVRYLPELVLNALPLAPGFIAMPYPANSPAALAAKEKSLQAGHILMSRRKP